MIFGFRQMSSADVDMMAERHYDRMLDEYLREDPEPWEEEPPTWDDVADIVDGLDWADIIGLLRSFYEGDADRMDELFTAGVLGKYVRPEITDVSAEVDRIFAEHWEDFNFWKHIYLEMPDAHRQAMCENLIESADNDGDDWLREAWNEIVRHRWECNRHDY